MKCLLTAGRILKVPKVCLKFLSVNEASYVSIIKKR